jgi:hypothetical protein
LIDWVDRSITECIELAENTLHPRESEAPATTFNCNFDDFINQLGKVVSPDLVREIEHNSKSTTTQRRRSHRTSGAPIFDNFSDSNDDATPLLSSHQGLMMTLTLSG